MRLARTVRYLLLCLVGVGIAACAAGQGGSTGSISGSDDRALLVRHTQTLLTELGYSPGRSDGVMDARTESAIRAYQRAHHRAPDGQPSWMLLADLQNRAHTRMMAYVQSRLAIDGFFRRKVDGRDDENTRNAIRAFQAANHLEVDGRVTPRLIQALEARSATTANVQTSDLPSVIVKREAAAPQSGTSGKNRRLVPGDQLAVSISGPGMGSGDPVNLTVDPGGMITLPDGGRVKAAGLRVPELENAIAMESLERYLHDLSVKVDMDDTTAPPQQP
jgi:peptidoglycan hydrolase-like protein with peptidoglycan-binding domain